MTEEPPAVERGSVKLTTNLNVGHMNTLVTKSEYLRTETNVTPDGSKVILNTNAVETQKISKNPSPKQYNRGNMSILSKGSNSSHPRDIVVTQSYGSTAFLPGRTATGAIDDLEKEQSLIEITDQKVTHEYL